MLRRLFSTIKISVFLLMCGTLIGVAAQAEVVLIDGLEIGNQYLADDPQQRRVPDNGGNSFIILKQYKTNCGPTSVEMVLHYYGITAGMSDVWREGGIHNVDIGTFPGEIRQALNGLGIPSLWLDSDSANYDPFPDLKQKIRESRPPILLLRDGSTSWHWVVGVGYNDAGDILVADPNGFFRWFSHNEMVRYWSLQETDDNPVFGTVVTGAGGLVAGTDPYTMVVPKDPPTKHFPPVWASMWGYRKSGSGFPAFGKMRSWNKTVTFKYPFDRFTVAAVQPLEFDVREGKFNPQLGKTSITGFEKVGDRSVKVTGKVQDWPLLSSVWVVIRAYRPTREPVLPKPASFTVSGISSGTTITSGDNRTISVFVKNDNGTPAPNVKVNFIDSDDDEISFKYTERKTNSSGKATTTLYTGSYGSADFTVRVDGVGDKRFTLRVQSWTKRFNRTGRVKGSWQPFCLEARRYKSRYRYVDVPSRRVKSTVTVEETGSTTHAYLKEWKWWDSDTVELHFRIRDKGCWGRFKWVDYKVSGLYEGSDSARRVAGAPALTPELDTLSEYWQDLSQVPLETDLLTNYPNPFNPETWIPYQLAAPAEVRISISAANGQLVRSLSLGHQPAGVYTSRSRAAHWDGKNEYGESVASGIYFYTLTAGDFRATRKMLILK